MSCVYILQCQGDKWYIGKTDNLQKRFQSHKRGSTQFTKIYKPISIKQVFNCISKNEQNTLEKEITLEYMLEYGWENVAGYCWSQIKRYKPHALIDFENKL